MEVNSQWEKYLTADMTTEELAMLDSLLSRLQESIVQRRWDEE